MKRLIAIFILIVFLFCSNSAFSQTILFPNASTRQNFSLQMSANPVFFIEAGYHYRFDNVIAGKSVFIHGVIGTPLFLMKEFDSFRIGLGGSVKWIEHGGFALVGGLFTSIATNENVNGNFIAWNFKLNLLPGYYSENWFAALDLAWKPTISTYINHSNYVKEAFKDRYPDSTPANEMIDGPEDGWYSTPANYVMAGMLAGYTLRHAYTIYVNGGIKYTPNDLGIFMFGDIGVIPYYMKLGIIYHK